MNSTTTPNRFVMITIWVTAALAALGGFLYILTQISQMVHGGESTPAASHFYMIQAAACIILMVGFSSLAMRKKRR